MSNAVVYGGQSSYQVTRGGPDGTGRPPREWTSLYQGTTYGASGYKSHIHAMERPVPIVPASPRPATSKSHSGYTKLARALNVEPGASAALQHIWQTVLVLRARKGAMLAPTDYDTWSTGSFSTNPIVPVEVANPLPEDAPRFAHPEVGDNAQTITLSAAWLIAHAGFHKGFGLNGEPPGVVNGRASLSTKHPLALANRGGPTTQDLISTVSTVRNGVESKWAIRLVPDPVLVGVQLGT